MQNSAERSGVGSRFPTVPTLKILNSARHQCGFKIRLDNPRGLHAEYMDNGFVKSRQRMINRNSISLFGVGSGTTLSLVLSAGLLLANELTTASHLGGSQGDRANAIARDESGAVYVAGYTASSDFPTKNALQPTLTSGFRSVFVSKFDANGTTLIYSTFLGGETSYEAHDMAVTPSGEAVIVGVAGPGWPTTSGAAQVTHGGGGIDAFICKLSADGSTLLYSSYLGGAGEDQAMAVALDSLGNAYVTGKTKSSDFPTTPGSAQTSYGGGTSFGDAFVAKVSADGSLLEYSSYLGGAGEDEGRDIDVDASGHAYIVGAGGSGFPVTSAAFQKTYLGGPSGFDAFAAKMSADGSALDYATYLAGSNDERAFGVAVDRGGRAHVTGNIGSDGLSTSSVVQEFRGGGSDAFVARLNATGSSLDFFSYLGGSGTDAGRAIRADNNGAIFVAGNSDSSNFPGKDATQVNRGGAQDSFLTILTDDGKKTIFSTYHGGSATEEPRGFHIADDGAAWLAGFTFSTDLSTAGAFQPTAQGDSDAFLSKFYSPPVRVSVSSPSATAATFHLSGETGRSYQIEASTDFNTWTPIVIGTAIGANIAGTVSHIETRPQFILTDKQFFRGVLQP